MSNGLYVSKSGAPYARTDHKVGSRIWGHTRIYEGGATVYVARRTMNDLYRGKQSISDAMRDGSAAWPLDEGTITMLRVKKIPYVAMCIENAAKRTVIEGYFLTPTSSFLGTGVDKLWKMHDFRKRSGSFQRWLSLKHFSERTTEVVIGLGA